MVLGKGCPLPERRFRVQSAGKYKFVPHLALLAV